MDGFYLARNLEPLKSVCEIALSQINDFIKARNESRKGDHEGKLVAYKISLSSSSIVNIDCLIECSLGLFFRPYRFYKTTCTLDDCLQSSAAYGFGFFELEMSVFEELRNFYHQNTAGARVEN